MLDKNIDTQSNAVRVLVVDSETMVVDALRVSTFGFGNFEWNQCISLNDCLALIKSESFDAILVDPQFISQARLPAIEKILEVAGKARVALFSDDVDIPLLAACIERGIAGFIDKKMPAGGVVSALTIIMLDQRFIPSEIIKLLIENETEVVLSTFQKSILKRAAQGLKNKEIGSDLGITEAQVKSQINSIRKKLTASNRAHAVVIGRRMGLF